MICKSLKATFSVAVAALLSLLLLWGCSSKDDFTVELNINDDVERTVVMTYNTPQGVKRLMEPMTGGKVKLKGECRDFTVAALAWSDGEPIAKCIVRNGSSVKLAIGPGATMPKVKGSEETRELFDFIGSNAALIASGDTAALNSAVSEFVESHHSSPSATVVLIDYLSLRDNGETADRLLELIEPAARPSNMLQNYGVINSRQIEANKPERLYPFGVFTAKTDSIERIIPGERRMTLLAFLSTARQARRRQVDALKTLQERSDSLKVRIVELSLQPDSTGWRASLQGDGKVDWVQGWMPGATSSSAMKRMAVPREPFYILIDSTGIQLYRGDSFAEALKKIEKQRRRVL